jgi:hypothetical protein
MQEEHVPIWVGRRRRDHLARHAARRDLLDTRASRRRGHPPFHPPETLALDFDRLRAVPVFDECAETEPHQFGAQTDPRA